MNLLDMVKDQISGPLASSAAGFLGESESNITSAMGGIVPGLLGKITDIASDEKGAQSILDMAKGTDAGMLDNISGLFSGGGDAINGLMNSGGGMLETLLGGNQSGFISKIAGLSGMSSGNTGSLLKMAAPMIMGLIGKQAMSGGLNASGLMSMLGGQKSMIQKLMPSGLGDTLGFAKGLGGDALDAGKKVVGGTVDAGKKVVGGAADLAGGAVDAGKKVVGGTVDAGKKVVGGAADLAGGAVDAGAKAGKSILRWLLPLLAILAILGFFGVRTGCSNIDNAASKVSDTTKNVATGAADMTKKAAGAVADGAGAVADGVGNAADAVAGAAGNVVEGAIDMTGDAFKWTAGALGDVFGKVDKVAKGAWDGMKVATGSAGDQIKKFVAGGFKGEPNFSLANANFASGSADLTGQMKGELNSVVAFMKAYPATKIAVMGHTDNTGDAAANLALSKARANSVKAHLMAGGVDASRLVSEGYGQNNPVADNSTKEGQAKNRRIELRLMK